MSQLTKHAILIGINDVPHLEYLSTPSNYAIQMEKWAKTQDYKTKLFVDEPNGEETGICSRNEILNTICEIIDNGTDQLLIYFSGHGIEHSAGNDVWLLPNYQRDTNDCISISLNKALAYTSGIPHIIFISDSCRVAPSLNSLKAASGSAILPNLDNLNPDTEVDVLYSTWPGELAVDVRNQDGSYRSIYSDNLLKCLKGNVPEVIKQIVNLTPGFPAILPYNLGSFLKKTVPIETAATGGKRQIPMSVVTSHDPLHLAKFGIDDLVTDSSVEHDVPMIIPSPISYRNKTVSTKLEEFKVIRGPAKGIEVDGVAGYLGQDHDFFTSPNVFNNDLTGLFVTGIQNPIVYAREPLNEWITQKTNFAIPQIIEYNENNYGHDYDTVLLVGNRRINRFYPITILKGFFTQVVFERGKVLTVNYYPTSGYRKEEAHNLSKEITRRKATIITAAKNGIFLGNEEIGDFLRRYKSLDPILGLFSAYAYFQKGNFSGVRSLYRIMNQERENVLGDIRILGKLSKVDEYLIDGHDEVNFNNINDIPLPMLTEGWSYLKLLPKNPWTYLSNHLEPGLWTSFNRDGLRYLIENQHYRRI